MMDEKQKKKVKQKWKSYTMRVDLQVSILVAVVVLCACLCLFIFHYTITYRSMIESLAKRTEAVYEYMEKITVAEDFESINVKADIDTQIYQTKKQIMEEIRSTAQIRYLYTAKKMEDGTYIYLLDGLDMDSDDFRYPGDRIEKENIPDLEKAYKGETVLPRQILNTSWGKIFLAYYPIHDKQTNKIIGVLGMEFEAQEQYDTFQSLKRITPIIIIVISLLSMLLSIKLFRRISNPRVKDLYNTDQLTQLKSRNAFEYDMKNLIATRNMEKQGIMVLDLDYLKKVNDTYGHASGDIYIKNTAAAIEAVQQSNTWAYRIGGDEFAVLMSLASDTALEEWEEAFRKEFRTLVSPQVPDANIAIGKAIFNPLKDIDILDTYKRADADMYCNKQNGRE